MREHREPLQLSHLLRDPDSTMLTIAFRHTVRRLFVRQGRFDRAGADAKKAWLHSGLRLHDAGLVSF